ncbi:MAG: hypothetical protein RQ875_06420 [Vicingaceae bacterium]|nr:hypothetical protein [Vicingaceae bacterium]
MDAKIRSAPTPAEEPIEYLDLLDTVQLIDFYEGYWAVKFNDTYGYLSELFLEHTPKVEKFRDSLVVEKQFEKEVELEIKQLNEKAKALTDWYNDSLERIEEEKRVVADKIVYRKLDYLLSFSLEHQWELLINIRGFVGYFEDESKKGKHEEHLTCSCGNRKGVFTENKYWQKFFTQPKSLLVPFLIDKMADTSETRLHRYETLTEGELAVYGLEFIYKKKWYNLSKEYPSNTSNKKNKPDFYYRDKELLFLDRLLKNKEKLNNLQNHWRALYKKKPK